MKASIPMKISSASTTCILQHHRMQWNPNSKLDNVDNVTEKISGTLVV